MKEKGARRLRGAISIFLVIILLSNAALIGVLVDGGRYRMARAETEAALDSATASVLSYYNQLVYDLYGLFATDSLSEDAIARLLSDYTKKTLGITPVDDSSVRQVNQAVYTALTGQQAQEEGLTVFQGFDYDINVTLDKNRNSLANTQAVESQIIDHMKYRAPLAMVDEVGGFMDKIQILFTVVDRIDAAMDKVNSDSDETKKQLAQDAADLLERIDAFNQGVLDFSVAPHDPPAAAGSEAKDPWDYVRKFDRSLDEQWQELDGGNGEPPEEELREAYEASLDTLLFTFEVVSRNADYYYTEANDIRDALDPLLARYETYIAQLQAKLDADPDNENLKTIYLPEIQLAQSTCGELVKNIDLVLMGRQYSKACADAMGEYEMMFTGAGEQVIDTRISSLAEEEQSPRQGYSIHLEKTISADLQPYGHGCHVLLEELTRQLHALNVYARDFENAQPVTVQTAEASQPAREEKEEQEGLRDLDKEALAVPYEQTAGEDWYQELDTTLDSGGLAKILRAGLDLIEGIGKVLEGARDSLYVNEYAVAYFPNYVQHYNATDQPIATQAKNSYLIDADSYFSPYSASQAELEYIITGQADAGRNVAAISARLLGIRLALNAAAIFTDSAKIAQANTMAAAISGPFAPLVATGLLIAWALAESALDVDCLLKGEDVELFKQGANWKLSAGGAVRGMVDNVAEYVTEEVSDALNGKIDDAAQAVEKAANQAIWEAYQQISAGADQAVQTAENSLNQWTRQVQSQLDDPQAQSALGNVSASVGGATQDAINGMLDDANERAMAMVSQTVRKTSKTLTDKVNTLQGQVQEKITNAVSGYLESILPSGTPTTTGSNTGDFDVTLNYMDYMRIFLLFMGNTTKVQRIQSLVQANLRYGGQKNFSMTGSYVSLSAKLEGSINFLMMSGPLLPASMRRDGRLHFTTYAQLGY